MSEINLYSIRINAGMGARWYKVKTFKTIEKTNEFLEKHEDFGLLAELKTINDKPVYAVARNDDKGTSKLKLTFDYEDTGFCQRYYRADCGRLFVIVGGQLHTCNDDAWREPCTPVNNDYFEFNE